MEIIIMVIVLLLTIFYFYVKKKQSYWADRGVVYIKPKFLIGSNSLLRQPGGFAKEIEKIYKEFKGKGLFGGFYLFIQPIILVTDLDLIKNIFIKDFQYFHDRGTYVNEKDDPLSAHLFSLSGSKWRKLRAKLSPTFTSGKMKMMFPLITETSVHFHDCLAEMLKNEDVIEIKEVLARFTTDVIGSCAFGIECNSLKNPNTEFRKIGNKAFERSRVQLIKILFALSFKNLAKKMRLIILNPEVTNFYLKIVRDTVDYREKNNVVRNDFMNLLIQLKNKGSIDGETEQYEKLTFEEIAAQAFIFFLAGFETSSTTMMFCLYELALNPDIQEKARQHINEVLASHDNKVTYESVADMVYLDQVINETLRKYPPVPNLLRTVTNDYKVPGTDHIFKKNMTLFIPVYGIQHDPDIYPDPEKFDPDRFSKEEVQKRNVCAFLPFGEGPRICIGLRFGMMQARIGLVTLLRNFKFSPCAKTLIPMVFSVNSGILSPEGGMYLKIEKL